MFTYCGDCVYWQWFLEVLLGPFSNANDRVMPMRDAVLSEGPKTTGIQQRSSALSLMHRDFSSFSESFDDVMHYRWWDLQSLCNLTLRNVVFKVFHNLFTHSFKDWRASANSYFWETFDMFSIFYCEYILARVFCKSFSFHFIKNKQNKTSQHFRNSGCTYYMVRVRIRVTCM